MAGCGAEKFAIRLYKQEILAGPATALCPIAKQLEFVIAVEITK
jgi:hypothetical protein